MRRAEVVDGRTIRVDGVTYRLWGVPDYGPDERCNFAGQSVFCAAAAHLALKLLTDGAKIECHPMNPTTTPVTAVCFADGAELGEMMNTIGFAD